MVRRLPKVESVKRLRQSTLHKFIHKTTTNYISLKISTTHTPTINSWITIYQGKLQPKSTTITLTYLGDQDFIVFLSWFIFYHTILCNFLAVELLSKCIGVLAGEAKPTPTHTTHARINQNGTLHREEVGVPEYNTTTYCTNTT